MSFTAILNFGKVLLGVIQSLANYLRDSKLIKAGEARQENKVLKKNAQDRKKADAARRNARKLVPDSELFGDSNDK